MTLFDAAQLIGTVSFALSGFFAGARKRLDILGILIAVVLTALGGGMIRDILVGQTPASLLDSTPIVIVLGTFLVAWITGLSRRDSLEQKLMFVLSDSLGLVAFSITGALIGLEAHLNFFGVVLLAFVTAVGGGIMRDILVNDQPVILSSEFYGSVAILIALSLLIADKLGVASQWVVVTVAAGGLTLRLLAYFRDWHLPKIGG